MSVGGFVYAFGAYSSDLKHSLQLNQTQVAAIGIAGDVGLYTALLQGLLYDAYGPKITLSVAGLLASVSLVLAAFLVSMGGSMAWLALIPCMYAVGQAGHGIFTAALMTNVGNFDPAARGTVVGCIVAMFGASPALFSGLYHGALAPNVSAFLAVVGLLFVAASGIGICVIRSLPFDGPQGGGGGYGRDPAREGLAGAQGLLASFDLSEGEDSSLESFDAFDTRSEEEEEEEEVDIHGKALLKEDTFWLLFVSLAILDGCMLMILNSLGALLEAMGSDASKTGLMAASAVCNVAGRVIFGFASDGLLKRYGIPRARSLIVVACIMVLNLMGLLVIGKAWLYPTLMGSGLAMGGLFNVIPTLIGELFGLAHYASNWATCVLAPALGATMFGLLFGRVFDAHTHGGSHSCKGQACYALSLVVGGVACGVAAVAAFVLDRKTRSR